MENVAEEQGLKLSNNFSHTNLLTLLKIQTVINSQCSMMEASNVAILVFSMRSFHFWKSSSHSP